MKVRASLIGLASSSHILRERAPDHDSSLGKFGKSLEVRRVAISGALVLCWQLRSGERGFVPLLAARRLSS